MSLITWTQEKFGTSVSKHDEEHQHLFNLLNKLHESVGQGERGTIGKNLDSLIAFVAEHFASEEKNMSAVGYPSLAQHKQEHDTLVQTCVDLQKKFHAGSAEITEQTTAFLRDWLIKHIPQIDFMYAPALKAGGIQ
ncbi:bacteriohemerythrin [Azovibrio restrictus]|uniref:bacteriohemerythrin n=1 Tax=Azovibrio restrictus TaxID=146938 RepID=UPI0003FA090B|nr:bacteriohemerythrin [Azovibrio restrictus]MCE1169749.1 bacteriohemerythrin [Azovibrio sp.]